jgi:hypothetical protein
MSWAGLANNQIVSFNNLQDAVTNGYFTALASIPVSNEEITKTDASTYVNCDPTYYLFAAKTSNQLIAKRDLVTTTTTTTTAAPLLRTFRVLNNDTVNTIELDVQINSVQVISPTVIPASAVLTLTPQVDCTGFTSELLEYQIVSGYTPSSAFFNNGSGTYTGTIAGGFITFTGVDLTPNTNQDLTVNP